LLFLAPIIVLTVLGVVLSQRNEAQYRSTALLDASSNPLVEDLVVGDDTFRFLSPGQGAALQVNDRLRTDVFVSDIAEKAGVDMSIIGVDDHEFSRVVELTTISQPVADHGSHAARLLIARIEGDQQLAVATGVSSAPDPVGSSSIYPEVHLVERSTTGRVHVGAGGENVPRT
jgi:hypothetical protein